ncbi:MAG: M56 family metallopeptidase [Verrucomicrobiota bacterium]
MFSILHSFPVEELDASAVAALLSEFILKSTLLLGAGLALGAVPGKWPVALRFRILWLTAMAAPVFLVTSFVSVSRDSAPGLTLTLPELSVSDAGSAADSALASSVEGNMAGEIFFSSGSQPEPAPHPDWVLIVALAWLTGVLAAGLRLGFHRWRLWRRTRRCWHRVTEGPLHESLNRIVGAAGLRYGTRLFLSREWIMPATWGWRRPSVVLPREAEQWSAARLGHVLTHECGHIARRDALTHFLSSLALALVWFHPLAWLTRRQLAALREAACDDWVLTRGEADPLAYGEDLLALVKHHFAQKNGGAAVHGMGIGMAKSSSAGKRIRRLLADNVNRGQPTRRARRGIFACWLGAVGAVSLMVSCRTAGSGESALMSGAGLNNPSLPPRVEISRSPDKPRAGADSIGFGIIEITMREGSSNYLSPWLPAKYAAEQPREALAFESLRPLTQIRGVDLMSADQAAEGQELRFSVLRDHRYPIQFDGNAQPLAFETKELGVRLIITGEKSRDGKVITADVDLTVTEHRGDQAFKNADGKPTGFGPRFNTRSLSRKGLKIPNGGFTIIPWSASTETEEIEFTPSGRRLWRKSFRPVTRYLGISANSAPLPPASAGVTPPKPVTFP